MYRDGSSMANVFLMVSSDFLRNASRQFGIANQVYTEYVIKRLEMFSREVALLKDLLEHSDSEVRRHFNRVTAIT